MERRKTTENVKLHLGTPVLHFVDADWCSRRIKAENNFWTANKWIINRFRAIRTVNIPYIRRT
jgi:hypothetical protein